MEVRPKGSIRDSVYQITWLEFPFADEPQNNWQDEPLIVPQFILGNLLPDRIVAFRVRNEAMIDENICEGDVVLVEKRPYARDGDIVVVFMQNKRVLLKKYYREGSDIELRPANNSFETIKVSADKILIQGVVKGLLRPVS